MATIPQTHGTLKPATPAVPRPTPPARCTLKWQDGGIEYLYTVEGESNQAVFAMLKEVKQAIATVRASHQPPVAPAAPPVETPPNPPFCHRHQVYMQQQQNARGSWYSHKAPDGSWCKGKEGRPGGSAY